MANSGRFLGAVRLRSDEQAATASNEVATSHRPVGPQRGRCVIATSVEGGAYGESSWDRTITYRPGVSRSVPGHQLAPQRRQFTTHRAVVDPVAHSHHDAAEDGSIGAEMSPDLLPDGLRQPLDDLFLEPR